MSHKAKIRGILKLLDFVSPSGALPNLAEAACWLGPSTYSWLSGSRTLAVVWSSFALYRAAKVLGFFGRAAKLAHHLKRKTFFR